MKMNDIHIGLLERIVEEKKNEGFHTKDISCHTEMLESHCIDPENPGNYHSIVGRVLSRRRDDLGIDETGTDSDRGSFWEKCPEIGKAEQKRQGTVGVHSPAGDPVGAEGLGPQSASDKPFTARMRLHQSWYRAHVLGLPCGTGPRPNSTKHYGNMLTLRGGELGRNFLTPEIAEVARERLRQKGGAVEPFRLFHNMLSSQPMCFNLFGPLVKDGELARKLVDALVPEDVERVLRVVVEWAPEPKSEYLNDNTAFDAFMEYLDSDGKKYALGIETKLTEPFSQKEYDKEEYRRWMVLPDAPWRDAADKKVASVEHNQLWRDHLLAFALGHHRKSDYAQCRLMLVRHPQDKDCMAALAAYRSCLKTEESFIDMPLDELSRRWNAVPSLDEARKNWLKAFKLRYLDLEKSAFLVD
jgi:hypothetical protein